MKVLTELVCELIEENGLSLDYECLGTFITDEFTEIDLIQKSSDNVNEIMVYKGMSTENGITFNEELNPILLDIISQLEIKLNTIIKLKIVTE